MVGDKLILPRIWLKAYREKSGKTVEVLAREFGITPQALWLIETGKRTPGLELAYKIGDTFGFDPRRFLESA